MKKMATNKKGTKDYWPMTEGVFNCLIDKDRTDVFRKAIANTVKKGDIVVDMGTGSGILAMFAADAGAKKVYAIENDENNFITLNETFKVNNYKNKIILIKGDVREIELPEKVDVIIGEMIASSLIEEQQIPAMNNILKFAKKNIKILLNKYEIYLDLVYNEEKYYDKNFPIIRYEYSDIESTQSNIFSNKIKLLEVDFNKVNRKNLIQKKVILKIKKNGVINGIRMSNKTIFFDGSVFEHSFAYSFPIILPIKSKSVKIDEKYSVNISYILCGGLGNLKYSLTKIKK